MSYNLQSQISSSIAASKHNLTTEELFRITLSVLRGLLHLDAESITNGLEFFKSNHEKGVLIDPIRHLIILNIRTHKPVTNWIVRNCARSTISTVESKPGVKKPIYELDEVIKNARSKNRSDVLELFQSINDQLPDKFFMVTFNSF